MPRRPDQKDEQAEAQYVSRSQKKRDSHALQALGEELTRFAESALASLPLTDDMREALREYRRIPSREGKRRHLQYLGRLMPESEDVQAISEGLENLRHIHGKR